MIYLTHINLPSPTICMLYPRPLCRPGSQLCFQRLREQSTDRVNNKSWFGYRLDSWLRVNLNSFKGFAETPGLVQVSELNRPLQAEAAKRDAANIAEQVSAIDQKERAWEGERRRYKQTQRQLITMDGSPQALPAHFLPGIRQPECGTLTKVGARRVLTILISCLTCSAWLIALARPGF